MKTIVTSLFLVSCFICVCFAEEIDSIVLSFNEPNKSATGKEAEDIKLECEVRDPNSGKLVPIKLEGTVDIGEHITKPMKNTKIAGAIQDMIDQAEEDGKIPQGSGCSITVSTNNQTTVTVAESQTSIWKAELEKSSVTVSNKSKQKGNKRRYLNAHPMGLAALVLYPSEEYPPITGQGTVDFGFENINGVDVVVNVDACGEYIDPRTGSTATGPKPIYVILIELATELSAASIQAGTPVIPVVYRNGIFFDYDGYGENYGMGVDWLNQTSNGFNRGEYTKAKTWIDGYNPGFHGNFSVVGMSGIIFHLPLKE